MRLPRTADCRTCPPRVSETPAHHCFLVWGSRPWTAGGKRSSADRHEPGLGQARSFNAPRRRVVHALSTARRFSRKKQRRGGQGVDNATRHPLETGDVPTGAYLPVSADIPMAGRGIRACNPATRMKGAMFAIPEWSPSSALMCGCWGCPERKIVGLVAPCFPPLFSSLGIATVDSPWKTLIASSADRLDRPDRASYFETSAAARYPRLVHGAGPQKNKGAVVKGWITQPGTGLERAMFAISGTSAGPQHSRIRRSPASGRSRSSGAAFPTACPPPLFRLRDRDRGQPVENAHRLIGASARPAGSSKLLRNAGGGALSTPCPRRRSPEKQRRGGQGVDNATRHRFETGDVRNHGRRRLGRRDRG